MVYLSAAVIADHHGIANRRRRFCHQTPKKTKTGLPYQATRLSQVILETRGFPSPPHNGFGFNSLLKISMSRPFYSDTK